MTTVRAPGKAILIGEYAVLGGAPAVVAAIDRYATATIGEGEPSSPFIRAAQEAARSALLHLGASAPVGTPIVDTSSFSSGGRKIGVGSSAAATVAAIGAIFAAAGFDPSSFRDQIRPAAADAHEAAQGERGSGADILAATQGGIQLLNGTAPTAPLPVQLRFVATSNSASTAALLRLCREAQPRSAAAIGEMAAAANEFLSAWAEADSGALFESVERAYGAYQALGAILGTPLVTEDHAAIHAAAARAGGAAKPSGAGGGDLAVAFLPDEEAARRFAAALPHPLMVLEMQVSAVGVHMTRLSAERTIPIERWSS